MEAVQLALAACLVLLTLGVLVGYIFWRFWWFWRNPPRSIPQGDHYLSPADGTVVYVQRARPGEPIIVCKQGRSAAINDIVREELSLPKILIGVFMSPFSVHYNRVPLGAILVEKKQYPAQGKNRFMRSMHWRLLLRRPPFYANSPHILENNRAVTRFRGLFRGEPVSYYVVQIGGGSVHGIDVYPESGEQVGQGAIFGMIRVGSQVDLIVPDVPGLEVLVAAGDRAVAGETILIR